MWTRLLIVLGAILSTGWCAARGGPCYSRSQKHCELSWTKLWEAQYLGQNRDICRYFEEVHKCTKTFTGQCEFSASERELYNKDIVKTYTSDKYRCPMMGGNMMMQDKNQGDTTSGKGPHTSSVAILSLAMLAMFLHHQT